MAESSSPERSYRSTIGRTADGIVSPVDALRSFRAAALRPLRRYIAHHAAVTPQDEAIDAIRARLDRVERLLDELVVAVAPLRPMVDLPATTLESIVAVTDRIEALERASSAVDPAAPTRQP